MAIEIERKFLVSGKNFLNNLLLNKMPKKIRQGYLSVEPTRTVRVRSIDSQGFLTIKGKNQGISRTEFEYEIPLNEAQTLLDTLCIQPLLEKKRYIYQDEFSQTWEIDVFFGQNEGLIIAEIELPSVDSIVQKPSWLGQEVSADPRYFNSNLQQHPFSAW